MDNNHLFNFIQYFGFQYNKKPINNETEQSEGQGKLNHSLLILHIYYILVLQNKQVQKFKFHLLNKELGPNNHCFNIEQVELSKFEARQQQFFICQIFQIDLLDIRELHLIKFTLIVNNSYKQVMSLKDCQNLPIYQVLNNKQMMINQIYQQDNMKDCRYILFSDCILSHDDQIYKNFYQRID